VSFVCSSNPASTAARMSFTRFLSSAMSIPASSLMFST